LDKVGEVTDLNLRILILSFSYPPNKDGVSMAASEMAGGFRKQGWEVSIFTCATSPPRTQDEKEGESIIEFGYAGKSPNPDVELIDSEETYSDLLCDPRWDAVVFHSYEAALYRAIPHLNKMTCAKILVSHGYAALLWHWGPKFPYGLVSWIRCFFRSIRMISWMRRFDRIVYLSDEADLRGFYDHLIAKVTGYKGRRVIPNGVDPLEKGNPQSDFRKKNGIAPGTFVFVCVANYSTRKDQGYGVRAFRKAGIKNAALVFIGSEFNEHSARFQREDIAATAGDQDPSIIWLEKQTRRETLDALASCDAFLLSANHEAQPISLLEAMRESKPWIARKAGCIESMEGGICVKSEDEMATAIRLLAKDVRLCERLGHEGSHAVATRYNRETYVESYCKLVEELRASKV
jgi:glycosyltransferase involved in cell wall biosynthesis